MTAKMSSMCALAGNLVIDAVVSWDKTEGCGGADALEAMFLARLHV
jgi:hypothetical protein